MKMKCIIDDVTKPSKRRVHDVFLSMPKDSLNATVIQMKKDKAPGSSNNPEGRINPKEYVLENVVR